MIRQAFPLVVVVALLNATLAFPLAASLDAERRPETLATAHRWVVPLLAGLLLAVLFPLERSVRRTWPGNQSDFMALFVGCTLALSLVTVSVGLNLVGLPLLDVHLASAFALALLLYWAWRYRALFAGPVPSELSPSYSVVLVLVGAWHLLSLFLRLIPRDTVTEAPAKAAISSYGAALSTIIAISCLLVAQLRRRRSAYVASATTTLSIWLAIDVPFGTAAFIYWLLRIRRHELDTPAA